MKSTQLYSFLWPLGKVGKNKIRCCTVGQHVRILEWRNMLQTNVSHVLFMFSLTQIVMVHNTVKTFCSTCPFPLLLWQNGAPQYTFWSVANVRSVILRKKFTSNAKSPFSSNIIWRKSKADPDPIKHSEFVAMQKIKSPVAVGHF